MIQHLKAKKHKGINEIRLLDLGHINVICGKNNSGKSSILEALSKESSFGIGKKIVDAEKLFNIFEPQSKNYTQPSPYNTQAWFRQHAQQLQATETIWFSDEVDLIRKTFYNSWNEDGYLRGYNASTIHYEGIVQQFLSTSVEQYRSILIPPKRTLYSQVVIEIGQNVEPTGLGIINRLFHLKTQYIFSPEAQTFQKISKAFNSITGFEFDIFTEKTNNALSLYFRKSEEDWIKADACGLGLSDVLVLTTFALDFDYTFLLVEEPESHLHPEIQKKLLTFFKSVKSKQFLLSTHSSVFLNPVVADKIYYVYFDKTVKVSDETSKSEILQSLGYSVADNIVSDAVVLTEGPTDIPILTAICTWMGLTEKYNIKFWPLGGDIMVGLDLSVFAERKNVIALIDSDPGSSVVRTRFEKSCKENALHCHRLKRYSIENYFSLEAIRKVFADTPALLTELKPDISVDEQMGFISNGKKSKSIKSKMHEIIKQMTLKDFEKTDLLVFCQEIEKVCKAWNKM